VSSRSYSVEIGKYNMDEIYFIDDKIYGDISEKEIIQDVIVGKSALSVYDDIKYDIEMSGRGLFLNYSFEGYSECKYENMPSSVSFKKNQSHIIALNEDEAKVSIPKGDLCSSSIVIKEEFLMKNMPEGIIKEEIIESFQKGCSSKLIVGKEINPQLQLIIKDILDTPFNGNLNEIFIQSKTLEIIYQEFKELALQNPSKNNSIKLDEDDIEAIKQAKQILIHNMKNPPSIVELARLVRINEFKLKYGFKKVYNNSPYNVLIEHKLEYAKELLINSDMNISEIATEVGYRYLQSFTKAFKKKFGLRPVDIIKTRKYYY